MDKHPFFGQIAEKLPISVHIKAKRASFAGKLFLYDSLQVLATTAGYCDKPFSSPPDLSHHSTFEPHERGRRKRGTSLKKII
jgi:hypothetical protein